MAVRVAINGFGRIGRCVLRAARGRDVEIVGINDLPDAKTLGHLFKYDSVHGIYPGSVEVEDNALVVEGNRIPYTSERDPAKLPWKSLGAKLVIESAMERKESRGLHYNVDHPQRDDVRFRCDTILRN